jgi:hypothetical protein
MANGFIGQLPFTTVPSARDDGFVCRRANIQECHRILSQCTVNINALPSEHCHLLVHAKN